MHRFDAIVANAARSAISAAACETANRGAVAPRGGVLRGPKQDPASRRNHGTCMKPSIVLAALALAACSAGAQAETFVVTRLDDPLPDACAPGDCSLREAMDAAGANDPFAGTDEIVLAAGTYTPIRGALAQVRQKLHVRGAGSTATRIAIAEDDVPLFVAGAGAELTLTGLGLSSTSATVLAQSGAWAGLDDVVVESGTVTDGGESAMEIRRSELRRTLYAYGALLVEDSSIFNLYAMPAQVGAPDVTVRRSVVDGTLYPDPPLSSTVTLHEGTFAMEDSTITQSRLYLIGPAAASVRDSTITRSSVAIDDAAASLRLDGVRYLDNGGPVRTEVAATVTIVDSEFRDNATRAIYAAGGADWNVSGSSFVDNRVDGNAGGAIVLEDDTELRISNSTFSGNTFAASAAADGARGAAIGYRNGAGAHLIVRHATFVAPAAPPSGIVGTLIGGHGRSVAVDLSNNILLGSCGMDSGVLANNSGNLEGPGDTCDLDTQEQQNRVGVSAAALGLGELGDHGGLTPTYLPADGSLAIDRAPAPQCLATDQRGYDRPHGAGCDVGAVEAGAGDAIFANGFEP